MPSVNLSPIFNGWQGFTPGGLPLGGGFVQTYQAGTSTPLSTYTTSAGNVTNSNPIALQADGRPPQEIWLVTGSAYKFVLMDSLLNIIGTYDNISGIDNSVPAVASQWVVTGLTPSFVNATTFTLAGDQTAIFSAGRRVRYTQNSGQNTGTISSSVFGALTTVSLVTDSVALNATLSAVDVGLLTAILSSEPGAFPALKTFSAGVKVGNAVQTDPATLDYYLEGSFAPVVTGVGGTPVVSGSSIVYWQRNGNRFFFDFFVNVTSMGGATGALQMTGFPFANASIDTSVFIGFAGSQANPPCYGVIALGDTIMQIKRSSDGANYNASTTIGTLVVSGNGSFRV